MTTEEAIHRAALRKHRHKGNYIATHEALLDEAEYLQQTRLYAYDKKPFWQTYKARRSLWQIIKGWFA